jgi:hypothetical protein
VSAYGAVDDGGGPTFPAFDYWADRLARLRACGSGTLAHAIDLYGNHDVWPGTLPILRFWSSRIEEELRRNRPGLDLRPPLPDDPAVVRSTSPPCRVELYRLNTIDSEIWPNTWARGTLQPDVGVRNGTASYQHAHQPLEEVLSLARTAMSNDPRTPAVRILLMHHPPHFFQATGSLSDLTEGVLANSRQLGQFLRDCRQSDGVAFHLVIAGHRHALDPAHGVTYRPLLGGEPQTPLPGTTAQLVTRSPTQSISGSAPRPAFCVYGLEVNDDVSELSVERTVYRWRTDTSSRFRPDDPVPAVIEQLPV